MLNISAQRLERTSTFNFVDNLFDKQETNIKITVFPIDSKAHRDALAEIERIKESGEEVNTQRFTAIVAAHLFHSHKGLEDDGKPLDVKDKDALAKILEDEFDLTNQIINHAKKKSNWSAKSTRSSATSKK